MCADKSRPFRDGIERSRDSFDKVTPIQSKTRLVNSHPARRSADEDETFDLRHRSLAQSLSYLTSGKRTRACRLFHRANQQSPLLSIVIVHLNQRRGGGRRAVPHLY